MAERTPRSTAPIGQQTKAFGPKKCSTETCAVPIQKLRAVITDSSKLISNRFNEASTSSTNVPSAQTVNYHCKVAPQLYTPNVKIKRFQPNLPNLNSCKNSRTPNVKIKRFQPNLPNLNSCKISRSPKIRTAVPMMPVIVDSRSLNPNVLAKNNMPSLPSGITITRTTAAAKNVSYRKEEVLPHVTVKKNSKVISSRVFFNMKEPVIIINLDDDDENENNKKDQFVVPIEYEPYENKTVFSNDSETMKSNLNDIKCSNKDDEVEIIDSSLDGSEKENDIPLFVSTDSSKCDHLKEKFAEETVGRNKNDESKINEENYIHTESNMPTEIEECIIYDNIKTIEYIMDFDNDRNDNFEKELEQKDTFLTPSKCIEGDENVCNKNITNHIPKLIDKSKSNENEKILDSHKCVANVIAFNNCTDSKCVNESTTNEFLSDTANIEDKETKYTKETILNNIKDYKNPLISNCKANSHSEQDLTNCKEILKNDDFNESCCVPKNSTDKKNVINTVAKNEQQEINKTYQTFLDLCLKLDKTDDMKKILKKLINYYNSVDVNYTNSDEFCFLVKQNMEKMLKNRKCLFIYIKEIADELRGRRAKYKVGEPNSHESDTSDENNTISKKIQKLERRARILNKAIKKLHEQEVDLEDEQDSAYILEHRYKARLVHIYEQLCTLKGERGIKYNRNVATVLSNISLESTKIPNVLTTLKLIASSRPRWFPDYAEILECVKRCATKTKMNLRDSEYESEARKIFVEIGTALQKRRQTVEYDDLCELMANCESDPADNDPILAASLKRNYQLSKKNEMEVINIYAEKENALKRDREKNDCSSSHRKNEKSASPISHEAKRFCSGDTEEDKKCKEDQKIANDHVDFIKDRVNSENNHSSESDIIILS